MIFQPQIVGKPLPTLTNPGTAADLRSGKQLIDANGNVLTGTMPTQGAQIIAPGTTAKTIAAGRYLTGTQTIQGDADLVAGNIKSGVNIFGVAGNALCFGEAYVTGESGNITISTNIPLAETRRNYIIFAEYAISGTEGDYTLRNNGRDNIIQCIFIEKISDEEWDATARYYNGYTKTLQGSYLGIVQVSSDRKKTIVTYNLGLCIALSSTAPYIHYIQG